MFLRKISLKLYLASKKIVIMKLGKIILTIITLAVVFVSCNDDDDSTSVVIRDRAEVYAEDLAEIETYLETHFFNYDDFDFTDPYNPSNDDFQIVFSSINSGETSLMDMLDLENGPLKYKMVEDEVEEGLFYKLYYLTIREGKGNVLNSVDQAFLGYEGSTTIGTVFDNSNAGKRFDLTQVTDGSQGIVTGLRESLIEFKTSTSYTDNGDGTESYNNHGIGAAFIPSGLGYFSTYRDDDLPEYTSLIFKFYLFDSVVLDHDFDNVPSFIENIDGDDDMFNDDTDEDGLPNIVDLDDDDDDVDSRDEVELKSYELDDSLMPFMSRDEAQDYFDANAASDETFVSINFMENGTYTLNTFVAPDSNGNGTPDYLDNTYPGE